jgi:hypothetical protein
MIANEMVYSPVSVVWNALSLIVVTLVISEEDELIDTVINVED